MITLVQLEYATALLHHGNFSLAANHVGISQPALSMQIKKLEGEVGMILFDRKSQRLTPTSEGKVFLKHAQLLLTQARQLNRLAIELSEDLGGELRIGIIPTLAPYLLPFFIKNLNKQYQKLKIHMVEALTEDIVYQLRSGDLDGGIIATPLESNIDFLQIPLFYEGFKLFVSEEHSLHHKSLIDVNEIKASDLWLLKEGNCFRDQVNNICDLTKDGEDQNLFYFESNSIEALCRIVEFRGGVTFLPELATIHLEVAKEEMIKDIKGPRRVREISMLSLPNNMRQQKLEKVAEVIVQSLPKNLTKKPKGVLVPTGVKI